MFSPPPVPAWDQMHPIVVHFPIALLLVAPLFFLIGIFWRAHARPLLTAACLMTVIGAAAAQVAVMTGEATGDVAMVPGIAEPVLDKHEDLAETARTIFLVLAGIAVVGTGVVWKLGDKAKRRFVVAGGLIYTAAHLMGGLVLVNTAHQGGRLVHEFGTLGWTVGDGGQMPENMEFEGE